MADHTIDLHDGNGKPLRLRVRLPYEVPSLIVISNDWATDDHHMTEFGFPRYFIRRDGKHCEIIPIFVAQPPCYVEREQPS